MNVLVLKNTNKKTLIFTLFIIATIFLISLYFILTKLNNSNLLNVQNGNDIKMITMKINNKILQVKLENNKAVVSLIQKLKNEDIIIDMRDYNHFEKLGNLGFNLPMNDKKITAEAGDLMLYQGNQISLFYDNNTWEYTKIGKVLNVSQKELKEIVGSGNITLTLSIDKKALFNFDSKTVKLNSGYEMPLNGIGTYSLTRDTCYNSIMSALNSGVRLIDTAYIYGNEEEIGRAIKDSGVPREEIFVITKIYPSQFNDPDKAIKMALEKLDVDYIDMMLLHHPGTNDVKSYKAMEKYVKKGKIRSIGLSNWYVKELKDFLPKISIIPALVQNEIHPYYQENDVIPYIQSLGIVVQGWYPFGGRGHTKALLNDNTILEIANEHNVTAAQVILRWNLQKGVVVIPGSSNPNHIKENTEIYHFELTDKEMEKMNSLNRDEKHDWY